MKIAQRKWTKELGWQYIEGLKSEIYPQVVFLFGSTLNLKEHVQIDYIKSLYPGAIIFGCSTSGEICSTQVIDDSIVITAVQFESTKVAAAQLFIKDTENSKDAGQKLASLIDHEDLTHVFVLSDGLAVNGSQFVNGLTSKLPENVTITGGLAGDGADFKETYVIFNDSISIKSIAIIGFYGKKINIGFGFHGGWDAFGPQRLITRSEGNVLYELDGHSALGLYKKYLGEHAKDLPSSGLLFPLSLRTNTNDIGVVRTILAVDEQNQSMTFAGEMPEGSYTQLMKANFDRIIDGAVNAAKTSSIAIACKPPELAILISCVGRKLVLKQRVEEEVEGVRETFGEGTILTGFYSYGEISPFTPNAKCELHNQTMTITTFRED